MEQWCILYSTGTVTTKREYSEILLIHTIAQFSLIKGLKLFFFMTVLSLQLLKSQVSDLYHNLGGGGGGGGDFCMII